MLAAAARPAESSGGGSGAEPGTAGQSRAPRRAARPALPANLSPRRQDAALLVPRQRRVPLGQDGPADGRRRARHAAVAEPEQPLRLLRGAGGLLSLHELPGGGRRR